MSAMVPSSLVNRRVSPLKATGLLVAATPSQSWSAPPSGSTPRPARCRSAERESWSRCACRRSRRASDARRALIPFRARPPCREREAAAHREMRRERREVGRCQNADVGLGNARAPWAWDPPRRRWPHAGPSKACQSTGAGGGASAFSLDRPTGRPRKPPTRSDERTLRHSGNRRMVGGDLPRRPLWQAAVLAEPQSAPTSARCPGER